MWGNSKKRTFRFWKKNVSLKNGETFRFADYTYKSMACELSDVWNLKKGK